MFPVAIAGMSRRAAKRSACVPLPLAGAPRSSRFGRRLSPRTTGSARSIGQSHSVARIPISRSPSAWGLRAASTTDGIRIGRSSSTVAGLNRCTTAGFIGRLLANQLASARLGRISVNARCPHRTRAVGHFTGAEGPAGLRRFQSSAGPLAAPSVTPATPAFRTRRALAEVLGALDHHGDALATPDAHSRNAQLDVAARHLVQERGENACPAGTDRMTQRNCASVDVHPVLRDGQLPTHRHRLSGERLVELEEIDVTNTDAGLVHGLPRRRYRPDPHDARLHSGGGVTAG